MTLICDEVPNGTALRDENEIGAETESYEILPHRAPWLIAMT